VHASAKGCFRGYSPHAAVEDGKPAPASVAPSESAGEPEQLLREFLVALLEEIKANLAKAG
jgi:hypothetical protein